MNRTSDPLPAGLSYVAAGSGGPGWTCTAFGQNVTCTSAAVIPVGVSGTPITINVQVLSNAVPSVTNTALVSGGNEPAVNRSNNSALVMVAVTNMAVNTFLADGAQTGLPGATVLCTHVFNAGLAHAPGCDDGGVGRRCRAHVDEIGAQCHAGGLAGAVNTARPGDVLEYVITYTNPASTTAMMVVISDNTPAFTNFNVASCCLPLPAALTSCLVSVQPMAGVGGNIQWTLTGQLNAGQSGNVIFRATVQ